MFRIDIRKLVRKLSGTSVIATPSRPTIKLRLEELEGRTLLSVSPLSAVLDASPPASSSVAAVVSDAFSMVEQQVQRIATIVQYASNVVNALGQELIQEVASIENELGSILGINPTVSTTASNSIASQSSSDSGTVQGPASGAGSGSSATPDRPITSGQGNTKAQPVISGVGSGIATPETSSNATVTGQVWLDNNGDNSLDDGEMGYSGARVTLYYQTSGGGNTWFTLGSTTTNSSKEGYNYSIAVPLSDPQNCLFRAVSLRTPYGI